MLSFDEAVARLLASVEPLPGERVSVFEADGRVLAEDVVAPYPLPMFDYSAMDGYAVRLADLSAALPVELPVPLTSSAGGERPKLAAGTACRIFTGAPIPDGADAVVMQENVETCGVGPELRARFGALPKSGAHIRRRGEDLHEGAVAIARGVRLTPGHVALAAALDRASLVVTRQPVVTVLGTGDELRSPGEHARASSVVESNGFFVAASARRAGAIARLGPFVPDDELRAQSAIEAGLAGSDMLVTIGGVSVGTRDVVRPALEAAGVTIDFYKVAIKPGKPITVGRRGATVVIGLPGNPASASLTFLLFGLPVLHKLCGNRSPLPPRRRMRVLGSLVRSPGRTEFARAKLALRDGETCAELLRNQASGAVTSFAEAEALVVVGAEDGPINDGDVHEVIVLADLG